jgi:hypothetical protein
MAKEDVIRGVICPTCGKEMYRHVMNGSSKNICLNESSEFYDWRCVDCIYVYSELWLNDERFNDFPFLVCRYEDGREKLYNLVGFRESNLAAFQKSGLKFKDWFMKHKKEFDKFKVPRI